MNIQPSEMRSDMTVMLKEILDNLDEIRSNVKTLERDVSKIKIDLQYCVKSNPSIKPGVACKTSFDANGLVTSGEALSIADLPDISIDNITGLREAIDEVKKPIQPSSGSNAVSPKAAENIVKVVYDSGIKVAWNKNGQIISHGDLNASDIPELPIDKIKGLPEALQEIESSIQSQNVAATGAESFTIHTDTNIKEKDTTDPELIRQLIERVGNIESQLTTLPDLTSISKSMDQLYQKLDSNSPITPGTFTKVMVDSNGLITGGSGIEMKDLPEDIVSRVSDMQETLSHKAEQGAVTELHNLQTELMNTVTLYSDILNAIPDRLNKLELKMESKADIESVQDLKSDLVRLQAILDKINNAYPLDMLKTEIDDLKQRINKLRFMMNMSNN